MGWYIMNIVFSCVFLTVILQRKAFQYLILPEGQGCGFLISYVPFRLVSKRCLNFKIQISFLLFSLDDVQYKTVLDLVSFIGFLSQFLDKKLIAKKNKKNKKIVTPSYSLTSRILPGYQEHSHNFKLHDTGFH